MLGGLTAHWRASWGLGGLTEEVDRNGADWKKWVLGP